MKRLLLVALLMPATLHAASSVCSVGHVDRKSELHWSESSLMTSPDCKFVVQIRPDPAGDAAAKAYVNRKLQKQRRLLFEVERDGTLYWDAKSNRVAFQDRYSYGVYRMLFFDLERGTSSAFASSTDDRLRQAAQSKLKPGEIIVRYWPSMASWLNGQAVVAVRLEIAAASEGPLVGRCVGILLSTISGLVLREISVVELNRLYDAKCTDLE